MFTDEISEGQVSVSDNSFHLVELGQMCGIHGLIAENAIDREELGRPEPVIFLVEIIIRLVSCRAPMNKVLVVVFYLLASACGGQFVEHVRR